MCRSISLSKIDSGIEIRGEREEGGGRGAGGAGGGGTQNLKKKVGNIGGVFIKRGS